MKASIIIPTYNRANQLFRCLKSLVALDFASDEYEIIVVDNGSTDNTKGVIEGYIKEHPQHIIRYFYDDIPGLLTGRHRGASEAKSKILVFIDDDIHADKDWLSAIVNTFNQHMDINIVGGKCLPLYENEPPQWLNYFWQCLPESGEMLPYLSLCNFGDEEKEINPTLVWGLNFSIRKDSLYELGGFHPDCIYSNLQYLQGDGESGLSLKAIEKGYKALYQPKALVYHEVPTERMTLGYFDKRSFYQGVSNSYTEIRRNNGITSMVTGTNIKRKIKNILRPMYRMVFPKRKVAILTEINFEKEMLLARCRAMERAGYYFHREIARKTPDVLNWVLKENYFDYNFPKL